LYERALVLLADVFEVTGEQHWLEWVRTDLRLWRSGAGGARHRGAFGGMGSMSDRPLTNPWSDAAVSQLTHVSTATASAQPERFVQIVAGSSPEPVLSWQECSGCGRGAVTAAELDRPAAAGWASWVVPRALTDGGSLASREPYRDHVRRVMDDRGLSLRERENGCASCGGSAWRTGSMSVF
jgi:hypothetical protein